MKNWKTRERLLFAAPLLILLVPLFGSFSTDALDRKLHALAGPDAVDCGTLSENDWSFGYKAYDAKAQKMEGCADAALDGRRPFYMRQWVHMDGIKTNFGIVRTPEGELLGIGYGVPKAVPFFLSWAARIEKFEPTPPIKPRKGKTRKKQHKLPTTRGWLFR